MSSSTHTAAGCVVKPRALISAIVVGLLVLMGWAGPACAGFAIPAPAPAGASPAAVAPALSPAEAKQMIDLLNDPQKRAAFTARLETLLKAQAAVAPPKPAATAVPLAPNSIGAQILTQSGDWLGVLTDQFVSFGRVMGDLPTVWAFTLRTLHDPALRARVLGAGWRLGLVLALAVLADIGTRRALRRPMRAIARRAPVLPPPSMAPEQAPEQASEQAPEIPVSARLRDEVVSAEGDALPPAETDPAMAEALAEARDSGEDQAAQESAAVATVLERRRFTRILHNVLRLPFVLACLVLDLLPLGLFLAVGYAGTLMAAPDVRAALRTAILAYAFCRLGTALTRMLVAPERPQLRLVHMSDHWAGFVLIWVRRILVLGSFGYAASHIGLMFGLPRPANQAFLKAIFLVVHLFAIIMVLQSRAAVAARIRSHDPHPGIGARLRNRLASIWHLIAIFYIAGLWLVWAAEIRDGYVRIWHVFLVTIGVLIVARLLSIVALGGLDRAMRVSDDTRQRFPGIEKRTRRYTPWLRGAISTALVLLTCLALLQVWGVNTLAWFGAHALGSQLVSACITILIAAAVAVALWEGVNSAMDSHMAHLSDNAQLAKAARLRTLLPILRTILLTALLGIFGLTALSQIGLDIAPLLAGAGILGVAIGFGSQKLVQDFITGIFLLIENAMQVGDWVTVAGLSGSVENLSIRTMRLRAGDGSVHIIPFSSVSTVTNVNRGIGNAAVSVCIPIAEDSDHVAEILGDIATEMRADPRFADMMRSDFQLWGVDKVEDGRLTIVGQITCSDSGRWGVQREFNRRMALRFKELGIRIATPIQTVFAHVVDDASSPPPAAPLDCAPPANQIQQSPPPAALGNSS